MARKKRTQLPPVTEQDRLEHPERLRDTPNGGEAWKCAYCGRYASSETQGGTYVCYAHGSVRKLEHHPLEFAQSNGEDKTPLLPGRPAIHSFSVGGKLINLDELVEAVKVHRSNPTDTPDDMPYLLAFLHELLDFTPSVAEAKGEVQPVLDEAIVNTPADASGTDRAAAHPADEQAQVVASAPTPADNGPDECGYEYFDKTYRFDFPREKLPPRNLNPCPCGSGKSFHMCHPHDHTQAVRVGLCFVQ